jgi:2-polyprenyl-3-methyl-5-hydroxy-6-metoxy-1,4-benzoquinol methylase
VLPFEPDMIICADVIEHIKNPDSVLQYFEYLKPKVIVISTPDRDLLLNYNGPPKNPAHVREWSYKEFSEYIGSFFKVKEHFISSVSQSTQVIVCKPKIDNTLKDMV